jgi:hypothetical protein
MRYEINSEGYIGTGDSGGATYHGSSDGEDFREACRNFAAADDDFAKYFDPERMTYWGCRLYPSMSDARAMFG